MSRLPRPESWFEAEAPLPGAARAMLGHLGHRGIASWPIWVAAAVALTAWAAIRSARSGFVHEVTVVLRVSEGSARASGSELTVGSLRAHVDELALTNSRLVELMRRHPGAFSELEKDPAGALEELRGHIEVSISENDFIEERSPSDPPRSARIALSFRSPNPELAWTVDHELAELVIGSTLEHQRAALSRARAAAAAAVKQAEAHADGVVSPAAIPSGEGAVLPAERSSAGALLRKAGEGAAAAELSLRAAEEQQSLRFEMVDPGRVPTRPPEGWSTWGWFLAVSLAVAWVIAGAFDPRVLDARDLAALNITPLGHLPALPGKP